jgi:hydroxymethylpyrimidine/phosphomethylpyrimidine kinase
MSPIRNTPSRPKARGKASRSSGHVVVLTIAGSDSGGGAGIQADLRTFSAHGLHGLTAIAAVTAQNTRSVTDVHVVPPASIEAQVDAVFDDFSIAAVKIGMLGNLATVRAVARALARHRPAHVVLDPVMVASSGASLLDAGAVGDLVDRLLPLATAITPNVPEAELLLGRKIRTAEEAEAAAHALHDLGAEAVLLKGGHLAGRTVVDVLYDGSQVHTHTHPRLKVSGHGTGCTLASAIASRLALGEALPEAVDGAIDYVHGALRHAWRPGRGSVSVLDHFWHWRPNEN